LTTMTVSDKPLRFGQRGDPEACSAIRQSESK
jgi:hypothetical protein